MVAPETALKMASNKRSLNMVIDAIKQLSERSGSLRHSITRYISMLYDVDVDLIKPKVKKALRQCVMLGLLTKRDGLYKFEGPWAGAPVRKGGAVVKARGAKRKTSAARMAFHTRPRGTVARRRSPQPSRRHKRRASRGGKARRRPQKRGGRKGRRRGGRKHALAAPLRVMSATPNAIDADADLILNDLFRSIDDACQRAKRQQHTQAITSPNDFPPAINNMSEDISGAISSHHGTASETIQPKQEDPEDKKDNNKPASDAGKELHNSQSDTSIYEKFQSEPEDEEEEEESEKELYKNESFQDFDD